MTRANIYVCETFIGEIGSDAYPQGDFWNYIWELHKQHVTEEEFVDKIYRLILDDYGSEYLPPLSRGVANWSYEYVWMSMNDSVKGTIFVREPDYDIIKRYNIYWYQPPGKLYIMEEFLDVWKKSN